MQMCSHKDKQELISVDKLRYFHKEHVSTINGDEKGLFRINAIKYDDIWYEYSHGDLQEIYFSHFEDFNVNEGQNGTYFMLNSITKSEKLAKGAYVSTRCSNVYARF